MPSIRGPESGPQWQSCCVPRIRTCWNRTGRCCLNRQHARGTCRNWDSASSMPQSGRLYRIVSAENLCIGWLETRSPAELSLYRHLNGIAHDIIAEFFSNRVIVPGVTTVA